MPWFTVRLKVKGVEVLRVEAESAEDAENLVYRHGDDHENVHHEFYDDIYPDTIESVVEDPE